jgi:fatty acid desaturase
MHKKLKIYSKYLALISALTTLAICLYVFSGAYTAAAIATIVWFVSPYVYLAFLINLVATKQTTFVALAISIITCIYGLVSLTDVTLINPAIDTATIHSNSPLWQWTILLILTLPLTLLNKFKNT